MTTIKLSKLLAIKAKADKKRNCRENLIESYIGLQPMAPALARLVLKHRITGENLEPVYTINTVNTESRETNLGKEAFSCPSKKSTVRECILINGESKSKYYKYSDDLTAAYCVMEEYARKNRMCLTAATVTFNDEVCNSLRDYSRGAVACINERLRGDRRGARNGWSSQCLVVLEESHKAVRVNAGTDSEQKRLHAHLLTITHDQDGCRVDDLRSILKVFGRTGVKNDIEITTTYIATLPYSASVRLDEEYSGELPTNEEDSLLSVEKTGLWKGVKSGRKVVFRRLAVNQRWADYLSKDLDKKNSLGEHSKSFGMINGLASEVAAYKKVKHQEGLAFKTIDFKILDKAIDSANDSGGKLQISKVLENYYKCMFRSNPITYSGINRSPVSV